MDLNRFQIVFFDGDCNLCKWSVDFLLKKDHRKKLHFASLQGETAKKLLSKKDREDLETFIFYKNEETHKKSDAALLVLNEMGGWFKILNVFWILPKFFRDFVYKVVAKNRYKVFGKRSTCRMPLTEESKRLLP